MSFFRKPCETRVNIQGAELAPNQVPPSALMQAFHWLRFGSGFGDDQRYVSVADGHSGRKEILHDFSGIVSIGLTRSSSVVTA